MAWDWGRMGSGAAGGAATGAAIGSIVPGVGTAIGAGVGGLFGLFAGASAAQENERADATRKTAEDQRNNAMTRLSEIATQQQGWLNADRERRNSMLNQVATQANPYGQGSQGLMDLMALQSGSIQRYFDNVENDARRSLARRGALGGAQETSLMRQLALDEARALSGSETQLRARAYDQAQDFERSRMSQMSGLLGMLGGDTGAGVYSNMANIYQQDANAAQARGERADQMLGSFIGTGISAIPYMRGVPQAPMATQRTAFSGMGWGA